ncbi:MAG: sigma-70 family RNA polymerase sigma factor, partial [Candidatus Omnitrophica bacterium]|nr:sigma-70 family RNA polymerase sigma factor [Candidatus Omnitrophota bacterium]
PENKKIIIEEIIQKSMGEKGFTHKGMDDLIEISFEEGMNVYLPTINQTTKKSTISSGNKIFVYIKQRLDRLELGQLNDVWPYYRFEVGIGTQEIFLWEKDFYAIVYKSGGTTKILINPAVKSDYDRAYYVFTILLSRAFKISVKDSSNIAGIIFKDKSVSDKSRKRLEDLLRREIERQKSDDRKPHALMKAATRRVGLAIYKGNTENSLTDYELAVNFAPGYEFIDTFSPIQFFNDHHSTTLKEKLWRGFGIIFIWMSMILPFVVLWLWFHGGYLIPSIALYLFASGKWLSALNARGKQPSRLIRIITAPVYLLYPINVFIHKAFNIISYIYQRPLLSMEEDKTLRKLMARVKKYEEEYGNFGELSINEQAIIIQKAQKGDKEARDRIVTTNLRLVMSIAKKHIRPEVILNDLIHQGSVGILLGLEKFDVNKSVAFSTYITWWIKKEIKDHIRGLKPLSVSSMPDQEMSFYKVVFEDLLSETGRIPAPSKIAQKMNSIRRQNFIEKIKKKYKRMPTKKEMQSVRVVTTKKVREIAKLTYSSFSINSSIFGDEGDQSFKGDSIGDKRAEDPSKQAEILVLEEIAEILTSREYKILEMRYGLKDNIPRTKVYIGNELGLTHQAISSIFKKIFKKLRFKLKDRSIPLATFESQRQELRNNKKKITSKGSVRNETRYKKVSEEKFIKELISLRDYLNSELQKLEKKKDLTDSVTFLQEISDFLTCVFNGMVDMENKMGQQLSSTVIEYLSSSKLARKQLIQKTNISASIVSQLVHLKYKRVRERDIENLLVAIPSLAAQCKEFNINKNHIINLYNRGDELFSRSLSCLCLKEEFGMEKLAALSFLNIDDIKSKLQGKALVENQKTFSNLKNNLERYQKIASAANAAFVKGVLNTNKGYSNIEEYPGYIRVEVFGHVFEGASWIQLRTNLKDHLVSAQVLRWTNEDIEILAKIFPDNVSTYWFIFQVQGVSEKSAYKLIKEKLKPVLDKDGRKEKIQELLVELKTRKQKTKQNKGPPNKGLIAWFIGLILLGLSFNAHAQTHAVNKNGIEMWTPGNYSEEITDDEYESNRSDSKAQRRYHVGGRAIYTEKDENGDWFLMVNGKPFVVKAVTYSPTPVGQSPDKGTMKSWTNEDSNHNNKADGPFDAWIDENRNGRRDPQEKRVGDFRIMRDMGVNAIRIFHHPQTLDKRVLRKLYQDYGIRVIMGDFLGQYTLGSGAEWSDGTDYSDPQQRENMLRSVEKMVRDHRNEPYILMWVLGNENNYQPNVQDNPETYYEFVNEAAALIKSMDPKHPVAISNGDLQFIKILAKNKSHIDIFMPNAYRGGFGFGALWQNAKNNLDMPVLIGEYGKSAIADEDAQANSHRRNWINIKRNSGGYPSGQGNAIGGVAFEYLDEWWKAKKEYKHNGRDDQTGVPPGEEWFGIFGQGDGTQSPFLRDPRKVYYLYKDKLWNDNPRKYHQEDYQDDDKLSFKGQFLKLFEFVGTAEAFEKRDISIFKQSLQNNRIDKNSLQEIEILSKQLSALPDRKITQGEELKTYYDAYGDFIFSAQKWNVRIEINVTRKILTYTADSFYESARRKATLISFIKRHYRISEKDAFFLDDLLMGQDTYYKSAITDEEGYVKYLLTETVEGREQFYVRVDEGETLELIIYGLVEKIFRGVRGDQISELLNRYSNIVISPDTVVDLFSIFQALSDYQELNKIVLKDVIDKEELHVNDLKVNIYYLSQMPEEFAELSAKVVYFSNNVYVNVGDFAGYIEEIIKNPLSRLPSSGKIFKDVLKKYGKEFVVNSLIREGLYERILQIAQNETDFDKENSHKLLTKHNVPLCQWYPTARQLQKNLVRIIYGIDARVELESISFLNKRNFHNFTDFEMLTEYDYASEITISAVYYHFSNLDMFSSRGKVVFLLSIPDQDIRMAARKIYEYYFGAITDIGSLNIPESVMEFYKARASENKQVEDAQNQKEVKTYESIDNVLQFGWPAGGLNENIAPVSYGKMFLAQKNGQRLNVDFENKIVAFYSKDFGEEGRLAEKRRRLFISDILSNPQVPAFVKEDFIGLEREPIIYLKYGAGDQTGQVKYVKTMTVDGENKFFVKIQEGENIPQLISSIVQKLHLKVTPAQMERVVTKYASSIPNTETVISIQPIIDELTYFHVIYHNNVIATQTFFIGKRPAMIQYLGKTPGNSMKGKGVVVLGGNVLIDLERAVMESSEGKKVNLREHIEDIITRELFEHAAVKSVLNDEVVRGDLNSLLTEYQVPLAYQYETMVVMQKYIGQIVYGRNAERAFKEAAFLSRQALDRLGQEVNLKPEDYAGEIIKKLLLKELDYSGDLDKLKIDEFINNFLEEEIRLAAKRLYERYFGELPKITTPEIPQEVIKYYLMNYFKKSSSLEIYRGFKVSSVIDFFFGTPAYADEIENSKQDLKQSSKEECLGLERALLEWPSGDFIGSEEMHFRENNRGDLVFLMQKGGERLEINITNKILSFYSGSFGFKEKTAMKKINDFVNEIKASRSIPTLVKSKVLAVVYDPNLFIKIGAFDDSRDFVKYLLTFTMDGQQKLLVRVSLGDIISSIIQDVAVKFNARVTEEQFTALYKEYADIRFVPGQVLDMDDLYRKLSYLTIINNNAVTYDQIYTINKDQVHVTYIDHIDDGIMDHVLAVFFDDNIIMHLRNLYAETRGKVRKAHRSGHQVSFREHRLRTMISERGADTVHRELLNETLYHEMFHAPSMRAVLEREDVRGQLRILLNQYRVPLKLQYWVMGEVQAYLGQAIYAPDIKMTLEDIRYMHSALDEVKNRKGSRQHDYVSDVVLGLIYQEFGYLPQEHDQVLNTFDDEAIRVATTHVYERYFSELPKLDTNGVSDTVMEFYFYEYLEKKYLKLLLIVFSLINVLLVLNLLRSKEIKLFARITRDLESKIEKNKLVILLFAGWFLSAFTNVAFAAQQPNAPPVFSNNILAMSGLQEVFFTIISYVIGAILVIRLRDHIRYVKEKNVLKEELRKLLAQILGTHPDLLKDDEHFVINMRMNLEAIRAFLDKVGERYDVTISDRYLPGAATINATSAILIKILRKKSSLFSKQKAEDSDITEGLDIPS